MKKTCTICKQEKQSTEFNKKNTAKDGLQNTCRECNRKRSRQYYHENREKHKKVVREKTKGYIRRNKRIVNELKLKNGCALCNETEPCCLQFHHLDPTQKDFEISRGLGGAKISVKTILYEIHKCACLCANCHFKVHAGLLKVNESQKCLVD